jgi:nucleoside transporter
MRFRLSAMMFLQYLVLGATLPIMSLYLRMHLGFSGAQTGAVLAMSAVAASTSPLVGAFVADRVLSAERLLALCHAGAAVLMALLATRSDFPSVLIIYLLYMLSLRPTIALTNAVAFHHMPQDRDRFAGVRVWGTVGWIAVGWAFSYLWLRGAGEDASRLPDALKLSAAASVVMFLYALTLPQPESGERERTSILPAESLAVLRRPEVMLLILVNFLVFLVYQYYYVGASPYLRHIGFAESGIMPAMSLGQLMEIVAMASLTVAVRRLGIKRVLTLGVLSEVTRFCIFAFARSTPLVLAGVSCHGISVAFFMTASLIFLDRRCSPAARSGVHLVFMITTFGLACIVGSLLAGWTTDLFTTAGVVQYRLFWRVPAVLSVVVLAVLLTIFPSAAVTEEKQRNSEGAK